MSSNFSVYGTLSNVSIFVSALEGTTVCAHCHSTHFSTVSRPKWIDLLALLHVRGGKVLAFGSEDVIALWLRCVVMLSFLQYIPSSLHCVTHLIQLNIPFRAPPEWLVTEAHFMHCSKFWLLAYNGSQVPF